MEQTPRHQGVLNLDKPPGISSAAAVGRVKRLLPRGTKIGHAGTLDPFATGVLLLLVGGATKLCESLMNAAKQYEAVIKLGATTATDDPESPEAPTPGVVPPTRAQVNEVMRTFTGEILQRPPAFSAMKIAGRRAYDIARRGGDVQLEPRVVRVYAIEMLGYNWPLARVRIDCGRGTYIRAIARDVGAALGVGGHLRELRRTCVGPFHVDRAVNIEQIAEQGPAAYLHSGAIDVASFASRTHSL